MVCYNMAASLTASNKTTITFKVCIVEKFMYIHRLIVFRIVVLAAVAQDEKEAYSHTETVIRCRTVVMM